MRRVRLALLGFLALGSASGCVRVAGSVARPTALERQLLGEYERLDDDLVHASSVRGDGARTSFDTLRADAVEQRSIQRYNEDDVLELKTEKCLAESLDAMLVERPCPASADEAVKRRVLRVLREENRARQSIITWAAYDLARRAGRPAPQPTELAEVRRTYQRLLREAAQPGQLAEVAPGTFREVAR